MVCLSGAGLPRLSWKKPLNGCSSRVVVLITVGRPFVKRFALCYHTVVCLLSVCPVCNVRAVRPNSWTDQDATWYRGRPWPRRHCVRWGPSSAFPKRGQSPLPTFRPMSIVAKLLDGSRWHSMEVGLGPGHIVLNGDTAPVPQKGTEPPIFGPCLLWSKRLGWIKTPLGKEVDIGPGYFVLDGFPAIAK